jgi:hypothetical protein
MKLAGINGCYFTGDPSIENCSLDLTEEFNGFPSGASGTENLFLYADTFTENLRDLQEFRTRLLFEGEIASSSGRTTPKEILSNW